MNYAAQHLAHLIQVKNDLNRRRRRFYTRKTIPQECRDSYKKYLPEKYKPFVDDPNFPMAWAEAGYRQAQQDMKAMTPLMREVRKEAGMSIVWGESGNILGMRPIGGHYVDMLRFNSDEFNRLVELYNADKILLGE